MTQTSVIETLVRWFRIGDCTAGLHMKGGASVPVLSRGPLSMYPKCLVAYMTQIVRATGGTLRPSWVIYSLDKRLMWRGNRTARLHRRLC